MSIEELEQYAKVNLNIPNVNFSGLEISTIKDIIESLSIVMQRYPALKSSICSIGNIDDINNQYNLVINSNKKKKIEWDDFVTNIGETMSAISVGAHIPIIKNGDVLELQSFTAIAFGEKIMGEDISELNDIAKFNAKAGFHPKHCTTFKSSIYHEMGHILDSILNLSRDRKLIGLILEKSNRCRNINASISEYALQGGLKDIIAEAFSEYMVCPESNDLIAAIGAYIDEKYKKYEDSKVFEINQKFFKHFIRAEKILLNERNKKL